MPEARRAVKRNIHITQWLSGFNCRAWQDGRLSGCAGGVAGRRYWGPEREPIKADVGSVRLLAVLLISAVVAGCSTTGAVPRPFPGAGHVPPREVAAPPAAFGDQVARTALGLQGSPYRNGGADPSGFDCSGFVYFVFWGQGLEIPRNVNDLYRLGRQVKRDGLRAGDLVFFTTVSRGASHVGVALGGDEFIHAPSSRGVVRIERLSAEYWDRRYIGARRLTD